MSRRVWIAGGVCAVLALALGAAALAVFLRSARYHRSRGDKYLKEHEYERAIEEYAKAIASDPNSADAYNGMGIARFHTVEPEEAIKDFTRAIELDSRFAQAYRNRGYVQHGWLRHAEALSDLSRAIDIDPGYGNAYFTRGEVHLYTGKPDLAIGDFLAAAENSRDPTLCYLSLGLAHLVARKPGLAEEALTKVLALDPSRTHATLMRGQARELKGDKPNAALDYRKVLEIMVETDEMAVLAREGLQRLESPPGKPMRSLGWMETRGMDTR